MAGAVDDSTINIVVVIIIINFFYYNTIFKTVTEEVFIAHVISLLHTALL